MVMRPGHSDKAAAFLAANKAVACAVLRHSGAPLKRQLGVLGTLDGQGHVLASEMLPKHVQDLRQQVMQAQFPGVYGWRYNRHELHLRCDSAPAPLAAEVLHNFADPAQRKGEAGPLTLSHFDLAHLCQDVTVSGPLASAIRACSALRLEHCFLSGGDKVLHVLAGDKLFSRLEIRHAVWAEEGLLRACDTPEVAERTWQWLQLLFQHNALVDVRFTGDTTPLGLVRCRVATTLCQREKRRLSASDSPTPRPMRVFHMEGDSLSTELLTDIMGWSHLESLRVVPQFTGGPDEVARFVESLEYLSVRAPASQLTDFQLLPTKGSPMHPRTHARGWKPAACKLIPPLVLYMGGGALTKLELGALPLNHLAAYQLARGLVDCEPPLVHLAFACSPECLISPAKYVDVKKAQTWNEVEYGTSQPGLCSAIQHLAKLTHLSMRLAYMRNDLLQSCPGYARVPCAEVVKALKEAIASLANLSELRLVCAGNDSNYGLRDSRILPACGGRLGLQPSHQDPAMPSARCVLAGEPDGADIWQAMLPAGPRVAHLQVWGTGSLDSLGGLPAVSSHLTTLRSLLVGCTRESSGTQNWTRDQYSVAQAPPCFKCLSELCHLRQLAVVSMQCSGDQLSSISALTGLEMLHLSEVMLPHQRVAEQSLRSALTSLTGLTELGLRRCVTGRSGLRRSRPDPTATGQCGEDKPLQWPERLDISDVSQKEWFGRLSGLRVLDLQVRERPHPIYDCPHPIMHV